MIVREYFEYVLDAIHRGEQLQTSYLKLSHRNIALNFTSVELTNEILPLFELLTLTEKPSAVELKIYVVDNSALKHKIKLPEIIDTVPIEDGIDVDLSKDHYQIIYYRYWNKLLLFDHKAKIGICIYNSIQDIAWWEKSAYLKEIFHIWSKELPAQLIHGGAIATGENNGYLLIGKGGSGKSTSCINLMLNGYNYLGDDYVWVEFGDDGNNKVVSLYQTAKLRTDNFLKNFMHLEKHLINPDSFRQTKAILKLDDLLQKRWIKTAIIKGILHPKITNGDTSSIEKNSSLNTFLSLAPNTIMQQTVNRKNSYKKISYLINTSKCYRWKLSTDINTNIDVFTNFVEQ